MPDTGSPYNLPYPTASQVPDVPADLKLLADAVHAKLAVVAGDSAAIGTRATALEKLTAVPTTAAFNLHKAAANFQITAQGCVRWGYLVYSWVQVKTLKAIAGGTIGDASNILMTTWTTTGVVPNIDLYPAPGIWDGNAAMASFNTGGMYLNHLEGGYTWPVNGIKRFGGFFFTATPSR